MYLGGITTLFFFLLFFGKWSYLSSFLTETGVSFVYTLGLLTDQSGLVSHRSPEWPCFVHSTFIAGAVVGRRIGCGRPISCGAFSLASALWSMALWQWSGLWESWEVSCELCIFPLVPTLNHRVHSPFWKAWRLLVISVVSPSPCDSLDRRFRTFSAAPEGATKPFFKPQNGIDILENHESAPRLPLLSSVHDCTDIWWKEACTASYFWTFIPLTCSAQACWLYGWLVSSFVSAPTWYSFVWTLAI